MKQTFVTVCLTIAAIGGLALLGTTKYRVLAVHDGGDFVTIATRSWAGVVDVPLPRPEAVKFGFVK
jgi:hypothetical protein